VEITGIYAESSIPGPSELRYNPRVAAILLFAIHLLTVLFFIGLVGSAAVVIISFVEDLGELFGKE
jgi:hypothetical protein